MLLIVVFFSFIGSFIPQTFEPEWYLENYPALGETVLALGLHRVFAQWYFVVVCVLLGISLTIATITRFICVRKILKNMFIIPEKGYHPIELNEENLVKLQGFVSDKHFKQLALRDGTVYYKNRLGYFGSVLVHLSILLTLVFGGALFALAQVEDVLIKPGETVELSDGSRMTLFSFRMYDDYGRRDYASVIEVVAPDGRSSGFREISVNRPLRFNNFRFYQFSYLFAGSITATDLRTGGSDHFFMVERSFLSDDGRTGIWFETVFQSFTEDENGRIVPLIYNVPIFPNPIYYIMRIDEHGTEAMFALPGSHVHAGNILFEFNEVVNYPGIRVSFAAQPLPALLYSAFGIMMLGLYLSFYHQPAILVIKGNRYRLTALKSSGIHREVKALLNDSGAKKQSQEETDPTEKTEQNSERKMEVDI